MSQPILVLGATGKTGGPVVRQLVARGEPVRAAVRSLERAAADPRLAGAEPAVFNYDDPASFGPVVEGVRAAFVVMPFSREMNQQGLAIHAALSNAGVQRIVRLSLLSEFIEDAIDLARWHRDLDEDLYQHCETPIFLRPDGFMQNLLGLGPAISNGVIQASTGDGRTAYIDAIDVARVAVEALTVEDFKPGVYDLTGPEAFDMDGLAALITEVFDVPLKAEDVPLDVMRRKYTAAGMPDWLVRTMVELQESTCAGIGGRVTDTVERVTGTPPRPLRDFLQQHSARLLGS